MRGRLWELWLGWLGWLWLFELGGGGGDGIWFKVTGMDHDNVMVWVA